MSELSFIRKYKTLYRILGRKVFFLPSLRKVYLGSLCAVYSLFAVSHFIGAPQNDINSALTYLDESYMEYSTVLEGM